MARRGADSADSSELLELRHALAREERIARALREVGNALGTTLEIDDLLELILGRLTDLLEADRSTLYLLDESAGELVSRIVVGQEVRSIRLKVGHGIAGTVAKTGKPIRIRDAYKDPRFEQEWDLLTGFRTTSMLAAPLKNHLGRTIGVIQVLNKRTADEFTFEDEAILSALSTQAAVAIDNSRLFLSLTQKNRQLLETKVQLEHRVKDLEILFELERSTARAASVEELCTAALLAAAKATEARGASILLAEDGSGDLVQYVCDAEAPGKLDRFGIKSGEGFLAHAMVQGTPLRVATAARRPEYNPRVEGRFPFPVESVAALALEGDGAPLGALGVFTKRGGRAFSDQDASLLALVTANVSTAVRLFNASAARERSERLTSIGRLLSQVIHDFKTPMTVISGYVQLLSGLDDAKQREEYARQILKQFDVLTAMQREVLEFARGERKVFVRRVYLNKFFNEIRQQLGHEIDGRAIELEIDVDPKLVARFDEAKMARAIHNLARNAVEAMADRGGRLTLRAGMVGPDLVMSVSDTGPGVPKEIEGRLFQSFVTAGKEGGTGLGLAIVKKIAEEHGGSVSVHSSDQGATFEMRIPQPAAVSEVTPLPERMEKTDGDGAPRAPVKTKGSKRRRSVRKSPVPKSPQ
ncbi:MAG TPA: GAF domain-containing sensor histidine kinase [Polyangiaceae bacterium]|nr:GAF domain-containing sensor histidine kinase [Polyangiaceae bacterium]